MSVLKLSVLYPYDCTVCVFYVTVLSRYKCAKTVSVFHMTVLSLYGCAKAVVCTVAV